MVSHRYFSPSVQTAKTIIAEILIQQDLAYNQAWFAVIDSTQLRLSGSWLSVGSFVTSCFWSLRDRTIFLVGLQLITP